MRMKILIIRTFPDILQINNYNVQEIGLAKAMVMRGHECDIVLFNGKNQSRIEVISFTKEGQEYSFNIYWMKGWCFLKNGFMPGVKKLIPQYDVIQVHEYDQIMSWQLYTKAKKPTVLYHGPYYHSYARGYNLKCQVFDKLFLWRRKYQHVPAMTKSELAADFLREKGFAHVIPVGVGINVDNFGQFDEFRQNEEKTEDLLRMLYVGKIEERRNVYFLIDVFRELKKRHSNLQLCLIGDGEQEYKDAFLASVKEELNNGTIVYKEKLSQKELPEIYAGSDLFLFTSNYDIFGMVLLEAMYYGLPVVSSMNGGASMLIRDDENGYILNEFDLEKWVEIIDALACNKDKRIKLSEAAKATIMEGYTWESMAGKFETVYQKAISNFDKN